MNRRTKTAVAQTLFKYRKRLIFILVLAVIQALFHLFKGNRAVMNYLTDNVTHPVRGFIALICSVTVWSVAEWLLILAALFAAGFVIAFAVAVIKRRGQLPQVLFSYLTLAAAIPLSVLALMTLLWNVNYHADSFTQKSGILVRDSGVDELYEVTALFASRLVEDSGVIARDENGYFAEDFEAMFDLSKTVFRGIEAEFPFLRGRELRSKKVFFSKALSEIRTTGVAFPFTGEANINIHQPLAWVPATIAHEIAHQRKVASEQEANFVAILACELSGSAAYRYSGNLLAYNYLASALAAEDYARFLEIAKTLPSGVNADLRLHYEYWKQFEGRVSEVSDSLYDGYLKNQGQALGTKSYGAVVDLLIAYYTPNG